jgi:hypothetical protein
LEEPEHAPWKNRKAADFRLDRAGDNDPGAANAGGVDGQRHRRERTSPIQNLSLFRNEADAQKQCPADKVVCGSSGQIGVYFVKGAGPYYDRGAGPQRVAGYYACMADAKKAGYRIGD